MNEDDEFKAFAKANDGFLAKLHRELEAEWPEILARLNLDTERREPTPSKQ